MQDSLPNVRPDPQSKLAAKLDERCAADTITGASIAPSQEKSGQHSNHLAGSPRGRRSLGAFARGRVRRWRQAMDDVLQRMAGALMDIDRESLPWRAPSARREAAEVGASLPAACSVAWALHGFRAPEERCFCWRPTPEGRARRQTNHDDGVPGKAVSGTENSEQLLDRRSER